MRKMILNKTLIIFISIFGLLITGLVESGQGAPDLTKFDFAKSRYLSVAEVTTFQKTPNVKDSHLKVEKVFGPLRDSTSMVFLGLNDILVLDKTKGTVNRIVNGTIQDKPILDLPVNFKGGRGLLGIALDRQRDGTIYVFLYFTLSLTGKDSEDLTDGASNRLYRYEFKENILTNPKLLLTVTATSPKGDAGHNGGKLVVGPDQNLYLVVGDLREHRTLAQNNSTGPPPDGSSVIYRITEDGKPAPGNPFGTIYPVNLFYAYGIRNSFGLDFDPQTGKLWDTENGVKYGDEINLVEPGFNSGWKRKQGFVINPDYSNSFTDIGVKGKSGKYSDPEFVWNLAVGPTDLKFLSTNKLGKQYENDMFVGDVVNGNVYHFDLEEKRSKLMLKGPLADKIADNYNELEPVIFARGFGVITDLEVGPDGYLYILTKSFQTESGEIWRIVPLVSN